MSEATTRARIYAVVGAVSNIGLVYDYQRWAVRWEDYLSLFKTTISSTSVIRGWTITCAGWADSEYLAGSYLQDDGKALVLRRYTFKIRGMFGLDDSAATEKTAIGIVEDVVEALDGDEKLHAWDAIAEQYFGEQAAATLDIFEPRLFGGALCHYAEITQRVTEAVKIS